jgi:hypothetical protein
MGWGARGNAWLLRNDRIAGRTTGRIADCIAGPTAGAARLAASPESEFDYTYDSAITTHLVTS